ncbi:hypothetical protein ABT117_34795 [Streptomyces sp. NPDC002262]|uniref:hypothetical protein n=1 Tax=Streptomyces sp. NPDC002262 TaxID=3154414 RepID=UPI0033305D90
MTSEPSLSTAPPEPPGSGKTPVPAWVVVVPSIVLAVFVPAVLGTLYTVATGGPRYLEAADVVGVWTEEGGDGRLTLREDRTFEFTETPSEVGAPRRGTWRVGIPDEPNLVELEFPAARSLYADESGRRATLYGFDGATSAEYVRASG